MLSELMEKKRRYLNHFFDNLDLDAANKVLQTLHNCPGGIFLTGVGKSGFVAEKIAVTLASIGTRALYLSPINALHGDIGIIAPQDVCVMLSKSGESEELLSLVPYLKNKGAHLIAVVSNSNSRLSKACHLSMNLPLERELCPFDKVPTTSSVIQMIFGDLLAIALMQRKQINLEQYATNHPAGSIGKRMTLKVRDLMHTGNKIPFCQSQKRLTEVLFELSNKQCGCLLIVTQDHILQGIFTDGDLRRALQKHQDKIFSMSMEELMTRMPRWTSPNVLAWDALKIMESDPFHPITALPVLNETQQVVGLLKMHDIIQSGL